MPRVDKPFHGLFGQKQNITLVTRLVQGAQALGDPLPSLVLIAPSGHGKTTFANAVAAAYGSDLHPFFVGPKTRDIDLCEALLELHFADMLFIDECHRLAPRVQEVLYMALDRECVPSICEGRLDRKKTLALQRFTLILATDQPGNINRALRNRMMPIEFESYSVRQLIQIAVQVARNEGFDITSQAARRLADASQGSPRLIHLRLKTFRYFQPDTERISLQDVVAFLRYLGIDDHGLTEHQRLYLVMLNRTPKGRSTLEFLTIKLGRDATSIRQDIEPYLIEKGYVEPQPVLGRRAITDAGRALAGAFEAAQSKGEGDAEEVA